MGSGRSSGELLLLFLLKIRTKNIILYQLNIQNTKCSNFEMDM